MLNPPLLQSLSGVIIEDSFKSCLWLRAIGHGYELLDSFYENNMTRAFTRSKPLEQFFDKK